MWTHEFQGGNLASRLGAATGQGIGAGLEDILQRKMQQYQQQQQAARTTKGLGALGYNPEQAQQLAMMSPEMLNHIIPQLQKQQYEQNLMKQYQTAKQGGMPPAGGQQATGLGVLGQQQQEFNPEDFYKPGVLESLGRPMQQQAPLTQGQQSQAAPMTEEAIRSKYAPQIQALDQAAMVPSLQQFALRDKANTISQMNSELEGVRAKTRLEQQQRQFEETTGIKKVGLQKEEKGKVVDTLKNTPRLIQNYETILKVAEKSPDKLRTGDYGKMMKSLGLGGYGLTPESNIFQNTLESLRLIKMRAFRGLGSMSEREFEALFASEPNLLQQPEGIVAIAKANKAAQEADFAYAKSYNKILKKNKDIPPLDIEFQALDDSEIQREKYAKQARDAYRAAGVNLEPEGQGNGNFRLGSPIKNIPDASTISYGVTKTYRDRYGNEEKVTGTKR